MSSPESVPVQAPKPKKAVNREELSHEERVKNAKPFKDWPEVLQILKSYSQAIVMAFQGSTAYVSGNYVLIDAPQEIAFELLRKSEQRGKMRDVIRQVTGQTYNLGPYRINTEKKDLDDPLAALVEDARAAGIEVIEETGDV